MIFLSKLVFCLTIGLLYRLYLFSVENSSQSRAQCLQALSEVDIYWEKSPLVTAEKTTRSFPRLFSLFSDHIYIFLFEWYTFNRVINSKRRNEI